MTKYARPLGFLLKLRAPLRFRRQAVWGLFGAFGREKTLSMVKNGLKEPIFTSRAGF